jgi:hypothetical protein
VIDGGETERLNVALELPLGLSASGPSHLVVVREHNTGMRGPEASLARIVSCHNSLLAEWSSAGCGDHRVVQA